jgi:protein phosphatase
VDELLTIGEFSPACGLSPKVLRTYAADGLLRPGAVDRGSGDRVMLCTDGLSGELDDQEIAAAVSAANQPGHAAAELLRRARGRGGPDDASAVVVDTRARSAAG